MRLENITGAIRLLFRKDKALYRSFYNILGFYPKNICYYQEAIMHRSMAARNENGKPVNNERLEFLGDAVLETVVSDILYRHFPNKREGFLTSARSKIVQRETLGKLADRIGLSKLIRHQNNMQGHNNYMGGNAFEALMGAIYLDQGFNRCQYFIQKRVIGHAMDLEKTAYVEVNFKSRLLEFCQKHRLSLDFSHVEEARDEKGAPYFHASIYIEGEMLGTGDGYSKREAQQQASRKILTRFKKENNLLHKMKEKSNADTSDTCQPQTQHEP